MFSIIAAQSLLFVLASATPWGPPPQYNGPGNSGSTSGAPSNGYGGGSSSGYGSSGQSGQSGVSYWKSGSGSSGSSGSQVPFKFPLQNGFPNIQIPSAALTAIEQAAQGSLPNTALPTSLADASASTFQAIATGELFEVAYFSALINNITSNAPGFEVGSGAVRSTVLKALLAVQAQEELHALGINGILKSAGRPTVAPCQYIFPVDSFDDAIQEASKFTDALALSPLQDALNLFATDGDSDVVGLLASVLGQEGEQNGFYRNLEGKVPSALPFLTRGTGTFAFSYLNQKYIVPGSCPTQIDVPVFQPLNLLTSNIAANDQQLQFSFSTSGQSSSGQSTQPQQTAPWRQNQGSSSQGQSTQGQSQSTSGLSLVYINQQNTPIVQPLGNLQTSGSQVTFSANFPYNENMLNGLTIACLTQGSGPFSSAEAVANATVYGPALIEVN